MHGRTEWKPTIDWSCYIGNRKISDISVKTRTQATFDSDLWRDLPRCSDWLHSMYSYSMGCTRKMARLWSPLDRSYFPWRVFCFINNNPKSSESCQRCFMWMTSYPDQVPANLPFYFYSGRLWSVLFHLASVVMYCTIFDTEICFVNERYHLSLTAMFWTI